MLCFFLFVSWGNNAKIVSESDLTNTSRGKMYSGVLTAQKGEYSSDWDLLSVSKAEESLQNTSARHVRLLDSLLAENSGAQKKIRSLEKPGYDVTTPNLKSKLKNNTARAEIFIEAAERERCRRAAKGALAWPRSDATSGIVLMPLC